MTYVALFAGDLGLDHCLALTAMANRLFVNAGSSSLSSPIGCEKPVRMPGSCLYTCASHGHGHVSVENTVSPDVPGIWNDRVKDRGQS